MGDVCDDCFSTPAGFPVDAKGCPLPVPGDFDHDDDVDQADFAHQQSCLGTTTPSRAPSCADADLNHDNAINASDSTLFIGCGTGRRGHPRKSSLHQLTRRASMRQSVVREVAEVLRAETPGVRHPSGCRETHQLANASMNIAAQQFTPREALASEFAAPLEKCEGSLPSMRSRQYGALVSI